MALRSASTSGSDQTEEAFILATVADDGSASAAAVVTSAADLDAHLIGPPSAGALSVSTFDVLDVFGRTGTITTGDDAAAAALRLGATVTEGWEIRVLDETVDMLTSAAASWDLAIDIPDAAVILSVQVNLQQAISATTATKVGIGTAGDPDLYGKTSGLSANAKIDTIPDYAVNSGAVDVQLFAVDVNGDAAGDIGGGATGTDEVRVRIVYIVLNSLDDA